MTSYNKLTAENRHKSCYNNEFKISY